MKRIGILTAGGDTPALNATIHGAVLRASQRRVEVFGFIKGFSSLFNPRVPHVRLNPLFTPDPRTRPDQRGGTIIGASRDYVDADDKADPRRGRRSAATAEHRGAHLHRRRRHAQRHAGAVRPPADRAGPQDHRQRPRPELPPRTRRMGARAVPRAARLPLRRAARRGAVRPGADGQLRHAGLRHGGVRLGLRRRSASAPRPRAIAASPSSRSWAGTPATSPWGRPTASPTSCSSPRCRSTSSAWSSASSKSTTCRRTSSSSAARGSWTSRAANSARRSTRPTRPATRSSPARPRRCGGLLIERLGDSYFTSKRRNESAEAAIFTRKVGHTQRGGRPIHFDRFYGAQLGGHAVDLLLEGHANARRHPAVEPRARLPHRRRPRPTTSATATGMIHARQVHPSFYDRDRLRPVATSASTTCCRSSTTPSARTTWKRSGRPCSTPAT